MSMMTNEEDINIPSTHEKKIYYLYGQSTPPCEINQKSGNRRGWRANLWRNPSASGDGEEVQLPRVGFTFASSPTLQEATDWKKGALHPGNEIEGTEGRFVPDSCCLRSIHGTGGRFPLPKIDSRHGSKLSGSTRAGAVPFSIAHALLLELPAAHPRQRWWRIGAGVEESHL